MARTEGRTALNAWIDSELYEWLKIQAVKERKYLYELLEEAIELLKAKREKRRL